MGGRRLLLRTSTATTPRTCWCRASTALPASRPPARRRADRPPLLLDRALQAEAVRGVRRGHLSRSPTASTSPPACAAPTTRRPHAHLRRHLRRPDHRRARQDQGRRLAPRVIVAYEVTRRHHPERPGVQGLPARRHQRPAEPAALHPGRLRHLQRAVDARQERDGVELRGRREGAHRGRRGAFNASVFYMDIDDLQATMTAGWCSLAHDLQRARRQQRGVRGRLLVRPEHQLGLRLLHQLQRFRAGLQRASGRGHGHRGGAAASHRASSSSRPPHLPVADRPGLAGLRHGHVLLHRRRPFHAGGRPGPRDVGHDVLR